jgi:hypothetical protein
VTPESESKTGVDSDSGFCGAEISHSDSDSNSDQIGVTAALLCIRASRDSDSGVGAEVGVENWSRLRFLLELGSIAPTPTPAFAEPKLVTPTPTPTKSEAQAALVSRESRVIRWACPSSKCLPEGSCPTFPNSIPACRHACMRYEYEPMI